MFAIPRDEKVYIGTTDTNYKGDMKEPGVTKEDVTYILDATNGLFPGYELTEADVESSWSGLRPLIHEEGKDPSDISRKDEIFVSESGLMTIAGGKLTGYRKMADSIVTQVAKFLEENGGRAYGPCQTKHLVLSGGDIGGSDQFDLFQASHIEAGKQLGLDETTATALVNRYGSNVTQVYAYLEDERAEEFGLPKALWASLRYAMTYEMALTPVDFLMRRSSALLFDIETATTYKEKITEAMATVLNWSDQEKHNHLVELEAQWRLVTLADVL